jgi:hypothetical protein
MPARKPDPARLLAAVNQQRAAMGSGPWTGPRTAQALGAAGVQAVLAAMDAGCAPELAALRAATVYLLGLLAEQAPGRAVEVRVPPYGAVQCVPGPRHTRGTPPNVAETDAVSWILLATGRMAWSAAVASGAMRASGPRSDLSGHLPLAGYRRPDPQVH